MLQQNYRFHGHASLRYLYHHGKTQRSRALSVRFAHNPKRVHSRCAIIVTRKVVKSAPKRNRIRRRMYELLRVNWHHIKAPYDISINIYDPNVLDMPHEELKANLIEALKRAAIWQSNPDIAKSDS